MAGMPNPVIVIPGVIATYLRDEYPLPPESIWEVLDSSKQYERASLHPNDLRYEAIQPARVMPGQIYEIAYKEMIEELRHNLRQREDRPVPVYPFGYDWRRPLKETVDALRQFVDEVVARTLLLRHYAGDKAYAANPRADLVGHSMGGLLIAGLLAASGRNHKVGSVVTLATPFRGSYEAVVKVTTGTANLGASPPSSREREAARVTPSLYHLLPSFPGALTVKGGAGRGASLFDPAVWQKSILDTIQQYIKNRAVDPGQLKAVDLLKAMLDQARDFRALTDGLDLSNCGLEDDAWLCVVGVDTETRVQLTVDLSGSSPNFIFDGSDRQNGWPGTDAQARERTGDGTVPFLGAVPPFLDRTRIVCVTPDDFGYWEIGDRVLAKAAGFHGILPNMDMLHRLIVAFLTDRKDRHGNIWGRRAPGVEKNDWNPPLAGLDDKTDS